MCVPQIMDEEILSLCTQDLLKLTLGLTQFGRSTSYECSTCLSHSPNHLATASMAAVSMDSLQRFELGGVTHLFRCLCATDGCNAAASLPAFLRKQTD